MKVLRYFRSWHLCQLLRVGWYLVLLGEGFVRTPLIRQPNRMWAWFIGTVLSDHPVGFYAGKIIFGPDWTLIRVGESADPASGWKASAVLSFEQLSSNMSYHIYSSVGWAFLGSGNRPQRHWSQCLLFNAVMYSSGWIRCAICEP